jgi:Arc-like DNA binding domain
MQNTTEDADVVATTVRFPRAVRHRLEDAARSSFRPLSGEIAHRIKLSFEQASDEGTAQPRTSR